jgi:hypothetical protein
LKVFQKNPLKRSPWFLFCRQLAKSPPPPPGRFFCSCYRRQQFSFIRYDVLSFVQESARFFLVIYSHLFIVLLFEECTFFSFFSFEEQQQTQLDKLFGTPQVKLIGIGPPWVSLADNFCWTLPWIRRTLLHNASYIS